MMVRRELWVARCLHLVLEARGMQARRQGRLSGAAAVRVLQGPMVGHHQPYVCGKDNGWGTGVKFLRPRSPSSWYEGYLVYMQILSG